jgi:hypothetical protein
MPSNQHSIFQDGPGPEAKPESRKKLRLSWITAPIKAVFYGLKNVTLLAAGFMFFWGMAEQYLPEKYRLSVFLATRVIHFENLKNSGTAKIEAGKAEAIAAAQQTVELRKTCEAARLSAAQTAYANCMSQPRSLVTGCTFQRDQVMQSMDCGDYRPEQLSPTTYQHMQQKGVLK